MLSELPPYTKQSSMNPMTGYDCCAILCTGFSQITVAFHNVTGTAIDKGSLDWDITVIE